MYNVRLFGIVTKNPPIQWIYTNKNEKNYFSLWKAIPITNLSGHLNGNFKNLLYSYLKGIKDNIQIYLNIITKYCAFKYTTQFWCSICTVGWL
jgi:hypothetical protein